MRSLQSLVRDRCWDRDGADRTQSESDTRDKREKLHVVENRELVGVRVCLSGDARVHKARATTGATRDGWLELHRPGASPSVVLRYKYCRFLLHMPASGSQEVC